MALSLWVGRILENFLVKSSSVSSTPHICTTPLDSKPTVINPGTSRWKSPLQGSTLSPSTRKTKGKWADSTATTSTPRLESSSSRKLETKWSMWVQDQLLSIKSAQSIYNLRQGSTSSAQKWCGSSGMITSTCSPPMAQITHLFHRLIGRLLLFSRKT